MPSKIQTAAGVICYINGTNHGVVTDVNLIIGSPRKPLGAIDSLLPFELAPMATVVTGTISLIRLYNDGGLERRGMSEGQFNLALEKYFTLVLLERQTQTIMYRVSQCSIESQTWKITAKNMVTGSFTFRGLVQS